ncbi:hypothetical protein [Enterobacter sp. EC_62]|uniref:hypothetical protein n=1 Tax=Enterobacter sp. EC_62 TaxID=2584091 RepID=UPI001C7082B9|nr:hypothetical protein [Enterobacter sp. EC_62]MBW9387897.1 hypothetical protein [Enterobacter sp. EC_62]
MSTITKEWLQQKIADMEAIRDDIPFGLGEDGTNTLAALRIALASLEAEPVAWRSLYYENHGLLTGSKNVLASWQKQGWECEPLYTAPPAPVSVPYLLEQFAEFMAAESIKSGDYPDGWQCKASNAAHEYAQNIRAAMLQGADGNSPVIPDGYVLVPKELTCEMDDAAWGAYHETRCMSDIWAALLAAAPQQEA